MGTTIATHTWYIVSDNDSRATAYFDWHLNDGVALNGFVLKQKIWEIVGYQKTMY